MMVRRLVAALAIAFSLGVMVLPAGIQGTGAPIAGIQGSGLETV